MKPTVHILVTVNDPVQFENCTLVFPYIRTGFPTADVHLWINDVKLDPELTNRIIEKIKTAHGELGEQVNTTVHGIEGKMHHGEWIRRIVTREHDPASGPLVILDPDTIFWKSVEDWTFPADVLLAGYYHSGMWNDFAKAISVSRIHTSFMWFPDVQKLREQIRDSYPLATKAHGEYCPVDPFMPAVRFVDGHPTFWDTCANLFHMLKPAQKFAFEPKHLEAFDHINSASFYKVMHERMDDPRGFEATHKVAIKDHANLKNLWPFMKNYYTQKNMEGQVVMSQRHSPQIV